MKTELLRMQGRASLQPVHAGTASAHNGVVLESDAGDRLTLVRVGGNPFNDDKTRALAGHRVDVQGYAHNGVLRFVDARVLD